MPKLSWKQLEDLWDVSCDLAKIENLYSQATAESSETMNNEVLKDLDVAGIQKKKISKNARTLSVITINNLDSGVKAKGSPQKRISFPSSTVAVAPLEVGSGMTSVGVLAAVTPVVGIMSSTLRGTYDNYSNV